MPACNGGLLQFTAILRLLRLHWTTATIDGRQTRIVLFAHAAFILRTRRNAGIFPYIHTVTLTGLYPKGGLYLKKVLEIMFIDKK